jgi:large subunit ribosomal protein L19
MNLVDVVNNVHAKKEKGAFPKFRTGDTLTVHTRITEGEKSRIQLFQGICISVKKFADVNGHFRVRKVSNGYGVERVFPFHSPNVDKIEITQKGKSKRAKLFYLRDRAGKSARIAIDYDRA